MRYNNGSTNVINLVNAFRLSIPSVKWIAPHALASLLLMMGSTPSAAKAAPEAVLTLAPSKANPRNSEGDFVTLKDGRILFIYTHFTGGGGDASTAHLASRTSSDGGRTWSDKDDLVMENDGKENIMSVSLLRLQDERIALLYLRKNSLVDCRPIIRFSTDEGTSWSAATEIIGEEDIGYYVVNNDRLVQLADGRLIVPTALHNNPSLNKFNGQGTIICYLSDDQAKTWRRAKSSQDGTSPGKKRTTLQEPGLVELRDGKLMMWTRTNGGSQFVCHSADRGETWSLFAPSSLKSPVSPASIERLPKTRDLVAVWNDHTDIAKELRGKRTPLSIAISTDEGQTWSTRKTLFDNPNGWYCYTAIEFLEEDILLGHSAGDRTKNNGLALTQVTRVPIKWLYAAEK